MGSTIITIWPNTNKNGDATSYAVAPVDPDGVINSAKFKEIATNVAAEYKRRKNQTYTVAVTFANVDTKVIISNLNILKTALEVTPVTPANTPNGHAARTIDNGTGVGNAGPDPGEHAYGTEAFPTAPAYTSGFSGVFRDDVIYAQNVNDLILKLNGAAAVCICNCNYCTCNCNYCTCNCNYACTCNCNYSDERLKENIMYCEDIACQ